MSDWFWFCATIVILSVPVWLPLSMEWFEKRRERRSKP